jgi:hypothetical protein
LLKLEKWLTNTRSTPSSAPKRKPSTHINALLDFDFNSGKTAGPSVLNKYSGLALASIIVSVCDCDCIRSKKNLLVALPTLYVLFDLVNNQLNVELLDYG